MPTPDVGQDEHQHREYLGQRGCARTAAHAISVHPTAARVGAQVLMLVL
jgi:hypothetical protein